MTRLHIELKIAFPALSLLALLLMVTEANAGVPIKVGVFKTTLLDFSKQNKKIVLVTLANTTKSDTDFDSHTVSSTKGNSSSAAEIKAAQGGKDKTGQNNNPQARNTNKFVAVDLLSPSLLKVDGVRVGSTSMIIWVKGPGDEKPTQSFYDVMVTPTCDNIEEQLKEVAPKDQIAVSYFNETAILTGNVSNDRIRDKAEKIALACVPKVLNHLRVDVPQQVLLQVKVAQVDKTSLKKLGVSFLIKGTSGEGFSNVIGAPSSSTTTTTSGGATTISTTSGTPGINGTTSGLGSYNPLDAFQAGVSYFPGGIGAVLQALSTKGLAKILAEPNLLVKSGQEGNFLAGSKIPYNVLISTSGAATSSIVFETVGVKLRFKPEVLENGLINLKIDPAEVSSIAGNLSVNGYPIIDTRDVKTQVELHDGESLVLAGLLQENQIKTMSKIPLLGDIPILGALFRSTQNDISEKELVFFITPTIVQPTPPGVTPVLPTDQTLSPDEEKEFDWMPRGE